MESSRILGQTFSLRRSSVIPLDPFSDSQIFGDVSGIERQLSEDYASLEAARSKDIHLHSQRRSGIVYMQMSLVSSSSLMVAVYTSEGFSSPLYWNTADKVLCQD